jgi:hypothetical protein
MRAKFSLFTVAALPIIPIALACGGDDGGGTITVRPDSGGTVDTAPVVCTAAANYTGAVAGSNTQFAGSDGSINGTGSDSFEVYYLGRMDPSSMPDLLQVTLYAGVGPFAAGINPANISLTGDELSFATCSACIFLFTDFHAVGSSYEIVDYYTPTAGMLNITNVEYTMNNTDGSAGSWMATFTGLKLQHMVPAGNDLVPANDGCTVDIPTMSMNAVIEKQEGSANGKPAGRRAMKFSLGNRTF